MCTLTFIPKPAGFLLAMNRDESLLRQTALPPVMVEKEGLEAAYPSEGGAGGTWIAANSAGIVMALLNQNRERACGPKLRSRGLVIPSLIHAGTMRRVVQRVEGMDFRGMLPFLLLAFFSSEQVIAEWKWDGSTLRSRPWTWRPRHWFSSGISDSMATQVRGSFCQDAWRRRDAGSAEWLRRIHASHAPAQGSFSVCVHRSEVASVSYTEICYDGSRTSLRYHGGRPCEALGRFDTELELHHRQFFSAAS
jgi:transport and Golgi organization protein 2